MILTTSTAQSTAFECLLGILRILIEFTTLDDNWSEAIASQVGMVECLVRLIARKRLNEIGLDGANNGAG